MNVEHYPRQLFMDEESGEDVEYHLIGDNGAVVAQVLYDGRLKIFHATRHDIPLVIRGLLMLRDVMFLDSLELLSNK